jgi:hypothetical protein
MLTAIVEVTDNLRAFESYTPALQPQGSFRRPRRKSRKSPSWLPGTSRGAHARGLRVHHAPDHDHGRANGGYRGPRGPNVPRAIANLRDNGRNADASSMPPQTEDAPNVLGPTCSGDPRAPNIPLSKRSLRLEAAQPLRTRSPVAGSRCTRKPALSSARRLPKPTVRHTSNSISSCGSFLEIHSMARFTVGNERSRAKPQRVPGATAAQTEDFATRCRL